MSTSQSKSAGKHLRNAEILSILVKHARQEKQALAATKLAGIIRAARSGGAKVRRPANIGR